jgi:dipeptidyl-peptidase-4
VYGGPHAQRVTNSWGVTVDMRAQLQASQGILVFKLDNRGRCVLLL